MATESNARAGRMPRCGILCYLIAAILFSWLAWAAVTWSRTSSQADYQSRKAESSYKAEMRLAASMNEDEAKTHQLIIAIKVYESEKSVEAFYQKWASELLDGIRILTPFTVGFAALGYWLRQRRGPLETSPNLRQAA